MEESIAYLQKPTQLSLSRLPAVDSSQVWIHSCKTNPVKCNDLDEFTTNLQEQQQQQDEGWETATIRTKRTRCDRADVLAKSAHESLEFPPSLSRIDESSLKPSSNAGQMSSQSIEPDSSASNSEDPDGEQVPEHSSGVVGRKKLKLIEELKSHKKQQNLDDKDQKRVYINRKTGDGLDSEVEKLHQSSFASNRGDFLDRDVMEMVLVDVQMTVNSSPLAEKNVPFVCLTSEAYGEAVMGYPLDVGEIRDGCETSLLSKGSVECKKFGERSRLDQLVWRKSKRSRVCYVTSSVSASEEARKNVKNSKLLDRENNSLLRKEKSLMKLLKDTKQSNRGKIAMKKTCVPVELIFSKILAAVN